MLRCCCVSFHNKNCLAIDDYRFVAVSFHDKIAWHLIALFANLLVVITPLYSDFCLGSETG